MSLGPGTSELTPTLVDPPRMPARIDTVRRQFDRRAAQFERHDAIVREVGRRLIDRLQFIRLDPRRVVDHRAVPAELGRPRAIAVVIDALERCARLPDAYVWGSAYVLDALCTVGVAQGDARSAQWIGRLQATAARTGLLQSTGVDTAAALTAGYNLAFLVGTVFALIATLLAALLLRHDRDADADGEARPAALEEARNEA